MDERLSALEFRRKPRPSPQAERALLALVRTVGGGRVRFRRGHGVGPYWLDVYCPEHRLAVEIATPRLAGDAAFHDQVRTRYLAASGIRVLSFAEGELVEDGPRVVRAIEEVLARSPAVVGGRRGPGSPEGGG